MPHSAGRIKLGLGLIVAVAAVVITYFTLVPPRTLLPQDDILLIRGYDLNNFRTTEIYGMDIGEGSVEHLFSLPSPFTDFNVSPKGDQLAYYFVGSMGGLSFTTPVNFYLSDVLGRNPFLMADNGSVFGRSSLYTRIPVWSPDGERVAMLTADPEYHRQVTILDVQTRDKSIIPIELTHPFEGPFWSPDSTLMAFFVGGEQDSGRLLIVSAEDNSIRRISPEDAEQGIHVYPLGWLPDSRELLVTRAQRGEDYSFVTIDRRIIDVDSGATQVLPDPAIPAFLDGKMGIIEWEFLDRTTAMVVLRDLETREDYGIQVFDLLTGEPRFPLTSHHGKLDFFASTYLSPDRKHLALIVNGSLIHVYEVEEGRRVAEIKLPAAIYKLIWTRDSKRLVISANSQVFIVNADESLEPRLLAQFGGTFMGWADDQP
jgi:hypothetical protein